MTGFQIYALFVAPWLVVALGAAVFWWARREARLGR
jgi:hypothetical protein